MANTFGSIKECENVEQTKLTPTCSLPRYILVKQILQREIIDCPIAASDPLETSLIQIKMTCISI